MQKPTTKHNIIKNAAAIELYKLRPPVAPGDLLVEYRDFAQYRWFIDLAQYDERLMLHMAVMLRDNLEKRGRINRRDLFSSLRKMASRMPDKEQMSAALKNILFEIYERVLISGRHNFSKTCLPSYQQAIDAVLKDMTLSNEAVNILISNAGKSFRILNRILNYPCAHTTISMWALGNFENDRYRHKRIKLLARILDDNPDFFLSQKVLESDHEFFNRHDLQALSEAEFSLQLDLERIRIEAGKEAAEKQRKTEDEAFVIWDDDFEGVPLFPKKAQTTFYVASHEQPEPMPLHERLRNKFMYRYYYMYHGQGTQLNSYLQLVDEYFYQNKTNIYHVVYLYGLYHSHLDMPVKTHLLQNFYLTTGSHLVINIARKMKNVEFLEWMMENDFEG